MGFEMILFIEVRLGRFAKRVLLAAFMSNIPYVDFRGSFPLVGSTYSGVLHIRL